MSVDAPPSHRRHRGRRHTLMPESVSTNSGFASWLTHMVCTAPAAPARTWASSSLSMPAAASTAPYRMAFSLPVRGEQGSCDQGRPTAPSRTAASCVGSAVGLHGGIRTDIVVDNVAQCHHRVLAKCHVGGGAHYGDNLWHGTCSHGTSTTTERMPSVRRISTREGEGK